MRSKTKPTISETVAAATTNGSVSGTRESVDAPSRSRSENEQHPVELDVLAACADVLLTNGNATFADVFERLAPALALDAHACFVTLENDRSLALDSASGMSDTAISSTTIAGVVAELINMGQRSIAFESLQQDMDARSRVFRDLGFASVVVGAIAVGERVLGAVVLAARVKERFTAVERRLLDSVLCYSALAYDRRELIRYRDSTERRKREFLAVLAHELRNPLAPVRNALEIIRANDRARSPVEHSAYAMIERQLQHIGRLADDLLDANQVVLGHIELEKQRVLLDAVIERAATQSRPWIEAARHTLAVDLPREAIALDADPKRLARVFSNLINHAARRMDRGGRITLNADQHDGELTVFVRTRGRIVPAESLSGIFGDAPHGDIADGQSQGGFTAGMTLVKHLVEMHGGTVAADTNAEGTAEFVVRLPVARVAALQPRRVSQAAAEIEGERTTTPHRILIADDNADSAESMGMLLRLMGNDVRIASDGMEAVEQAAAFQPDIVLMDIGMPRLDGYEAARRIRDQDWSHDTLLVAVTGWGPSDDNEEATAAGFDAHFTKPLDPAELRRLVSGLRPH